jgi:hypothetical protein
MKDYRHLIDQLAKLKFNVLYAQIYPHQPSFTSRCGTNPR